MLVLTRMVGKTLIINDDISVTILGVKGFQVRLGIVAPPTVSVHREEIWLKIKEESDEKANLDRNI